LNERLNSQRHIGGGSRLPDTRGLAPIGEITVNPRADYYQHTLAGLDVFALELFRHHCDGPATRRLHYMASRLNLRQTSFPGWKLPLTSASQTTEP
jgi:hypothetical protein